MTHDPLARPDGTDPDGFSRRVAEAYDRLVSTGCRKPAVWIAAEADVPVTTAHRWIANARQRGHLGPAANYNLWTLVANELGITADELRQAVSKHTSKGLQL